MICKVKLKIYNLRNKTIFLNYKNIKPIIILNKINNK